MTCLNTVQFMLKTQLVDSSQTINTELAEEFLLLFVFFEYIYVYTIVSPRIVGAHSLASTPYLL